MTSSPCTLLDPIFDMEPAKENTVFGSAWRDRRTGLSFSLDSIVDNHGFGIWFFSVTHDTLLPRRKDIVRIIIKRVSYRLVDGNKWAVYQVRKNDFIERLRHYEQKRKGGGWQRDDRGIIDKFVDHLGGDDLFFELCLKGIRACNKRKPGHDVFGNVADRVEFAIIGS